MAAPTDKSKTIFNFDPRSIPGCKLWLDAADWYTICNNPSVTLGYTSGPGSAYLSSWKDKSIYSTAVTFYPYIQFRENVTSVYPSNASALTGNYIQVGVDSRKTVNPYFNIFIVYNRNSATDQGGLWGGLDGTAYVDSRYQYLCNTTNNYGVTTGSYSFSTISGLNTTNTILYSANLAYDNLNTLSKVYVNGVLSASFVEGYASYAGSDTNTYLANISCNTSSQGNKIFINEVLIYTTPMTDSERIQVEGYLAYKWKLTLPVTHPYYYVPPMNRYLTPNDLEYLPIAWFDAADLRTLNGYDPATRKLPLSYNGATCNISGVSGTSNYSTGVLSYWVNKGISRADAQLNTYGYGTGYTLPKINTNALNGLTAVSFSTTDTLNTIPFPMSAYGKTWCSLLRIDGDMSHNVHSYSGEIAQVYDLSGSGIGTGAQTTDYNFAGGQGAGAGISFNSNDQAYSYIAGPGANPYIKATFTGTNPCNVWLNFCAVQDCFQSTNNVVTLDGNVLTLSTNTQGPPNYSQNYDTLAMHISQIDATTNGIPNTFAEICLYDGVLLPNDRQRMEGYFSWKWNRQSSYSINHPFAYFPPSIPILNNPLQLSNLTLWLDGNSLANTSPSSPFSFYSVPSGATSYYMTGPGSISNNVLNGMSALYTSGTWYSTTLPSSEFTLFTLAKQITTGLTFASIDNGYVFGYSNSNQALCKAGGGTFSTATITTDSLWSIQSFGINSTGYGFLNWNGCNQVNFSTAFSNMSQLYFNQCNSGTSLVAEVALFQRALSISEVYRMEGYLAWKWGLVSNLPVWHPYSSFPPSVQNGIPVYHPAGAMSGGGGSGSGSGSGSGTGTGGGGGTTYTWYTTGSSQTWTAPAGVYSVAVVLYGAGGGSDTSGGSGGSGSLVSGTLSVTPSYSYTLIVGGAGGGSYSGYGGGGASGGGTQGVGGGRSAIIYSGTELAVAAGGGGAAGIYSGGKGGGSTGGTPTVGNGTAPTGGSTSGGSGGIYSFKGTFYGGNGSSNVGGNARTSGTAYGGGGGGSGYYGGGGGSTGSQGGAGGSDYTGGLSGTIVSSQGSGSAPGTDGYITLTY